VSSDESPLCPICSGSLSGYDSRLRHVIQADGSRESYRLKGLHCQGYRGDARSSFINNPFVESTKNN